MSEAEVEAVEIDIHEVYDIVGRTLGPSKPVIINQEKIDHFAETTGDLQWIHTDPVRAANSNFGSTIAHGFLVLSLIAVFNQELVRITGTTSRVNYGLNKVRFPSPVPVGSQVRGYTTLKSINAVNAGTQLVFGLKVMVDGMEKPACIAELVSLIPEIAATKREGQCDVRSE